MSVEHNRNMGDLLDEISALLPEARFIHAYSGHSVSESALTVPWARRIAARFSFPPI